MLTLLHTARQTQTLLNISVICRYLGLSFRTPQVENKAEKLSQFRNSRSHNVCLIVSLHFVLATINKDWRRYLFCICIWPRFESKFVWLAKSPVLTLSFSYGSPHEASAEMDPRSCLRLWCSQVWAVYRDEVMIWWGDLVQVNLKTISQDNV